ncbi:hypothetical protein OIDMADRAFT_17090 [Oidiodendron maius Zn]|uniref:Uncharacterized protein n=1 Tax=Oidiodendron maius (strain Zn) TaxID=913774 RepID=A0A0C3DV38_OIDMZ|nr:hypothetical protein OIDMADRAFT_17090 [Oidiodendron maius Zn]
MLYYAGLATLAFQIVTNPSALPCLIPPQAINPHSSPHTQTLECKKTPYPNPILHQKCKAAALV